VGALNASISLTRARAVKNQNTDSHYLLLSQPVFLLLEYSNSKWP